MAKGKRKRRNRQYPPGIPRELRQASGGDDALTERQELEQWKRRVAHARQIRQDWQEQYSVELLERFFLGKQDGLGIYDSDNSGIWLNHFAATVQTQRPALLPTKLSFIVAPKAGQPHTEQIKVRAQAGVLEAIAAQDGHLMKSLRLAMTQAFFRIGVLKSCYEPTEQPNPQGGEPMYAKDDGGVEAINPQTGLPIPLLDPETGGEMREPATLVTDEVYRWRWVNARNMLLPDEGPDTTTWTWIGEEIEVTLDEAKADTRFPKAKRDAFRANGIIRHSDSSYDAEQEYREKQMFRYTECWDMFGERLRIWADGQTFDGFLLNEPVPDGVEDHPYAILLPVPIIAPQPSPWPKPLTFDWLPIQIQYNILRQQMINAGKRSARKVYYTEGTFADADEQMKAMSSAADMEGVRILDINRPPIVQADAALPPNVAQNIPFLLNDWQRVTGATGTRLGNPDADTATEAVLAEQSAGVRDSEMRTMVQEWLTEAGKKMLQLVKQTLTLDLWIQLKEFDNADIQAFLSSEGFRAYLALRVGEENVPHVLQVMRALPGIEEVLKQRFGQLKPLKVTRSQLVNEGEVTVMPSTVRPLYKAQLLQLMGILGPAALLSPTLIEELLFSFELPQGDRIAEEILANLKQQALAQQAAQAQQGAIPQARPVPGTPNSRNGANPVGTQNPLGAVSGGGI